MFCAKVLGKYLGVGPMNKHDHLSSVLQPVNTANGLPNAHYIDPEVFDEEKTAVLFANSAFSML